MSHGPNQIKLRLWITISMHGKHLEIWEIFCFCDFEAKIYHFKMDISAFFFHNFDRHFDHIPVKCCILSSPNYKISCTLLFKPGESIQRQNLQGVLVYRRWRPFLRGFPGHDVCLQRRCAQKRQGRVRLQDIRWELVSCITSPKSSLFCHQSSLFRAVKVDHPFWIYQ